MDQDKVNPFVGNAETSAGGSPVSVPSSTTVSSTPVNPYAPAGAPYAPGSNTPTPSYATPMQPLNGPAVPNTSASSNDFAFTAISPAPEKPKLFSKKFLILAGIGVALIIAAVVTGIILQNNRGGTKNSNTQSTYPSTTEGNTNGLNSYMNYILLGSDSNKAYTDEYNANTVYYIETVINGVKGYNADIARTMLAKWDAFYSSLDDEQKSNIAIGDYNALMEFFRIYGNVTPLTDEELLSIFIKGQDGNEYLTNYYSTYVDSYSPYAKIYGDILINYGSSSFSKYQIYSRNGCISDNKLDEECLEPKTFSDDDDQKIIEFNRYASLKRSTFSNDAKSIVLSVWDVKYAINGEGQV
ncbi:hypothetical protein IJG90_04515 [Candidatus Saccharibacteria bacterium]|nr:hypothetical protein [Candidatus Saccharibacteria bacterium]MBQ3468366.1 hypothetical protein [Candidatus Saccharibacteria bacterium]